MCVNINVHEQFMCVGESVQDDSLSLSLFSHNNLLQSDGLHLVSHHRNTIPSSNPSQPRSPPDTRLPQKERPHCSTLHPKL